MTRASLVWVSLFAAVCVVIFGCSFLLRSPARSQEGRTSIGDDSPSERALTAVEADAVLNNANDAAPQSNSANTVLRWIAQTTDTDPRIRAAAITALASAPRAQASPALKNVLDRGEPSVDRRLALRSLRALAQQQGDADGGIRTVLRDAIYHGDGTLPADEVQTVLDQVEGDVVHTHP